MARSFCISAEARKKRNTLGRTAKCVDVKTVLEGDFSELAGMRWKTFLFYRNLLI